MMRTNPGWLTVNAVLFCAFVLGTLAGGCASTSTLRPADLGADKKIAVIATARIKGELPYDRVLVVLSVTRGYEGLTSWTKYEGVAVPFGEGFRTRAAQRIGEVLKSHYQAEVVLPGQGPKPFDEAGLLDLPDYDLGGSPVWKSSTGEEVPGPLAALREKGIDYLLLFVYTLVPALYWDPPQESGRLVTLNSLVIYSTADGSVFYMPSPFDMLAENEAWPVSPADAPGCDLYNRSTADAAGAQPLRPVEEILATCTWEELEPAMLEIVKRSASRYLRPAEDKDE
jgi:hypothetical protein